jgi:hypothetical protein
VIGKGLSELQVVEVAFSEPGVACSLNGISDDIYHSRIIESVTLAKFIGFG